MEDTTLKFFTRVFLFLLFAFSILLYYKHLHPDQPDTVKPVQVQLMQKASDLCGTKLVTNFKIDDKNNPTWDCR